VSDRVAIEERRRRWVEVTCAADAEESAALLTEDVVWFPPNSEALSGRAAVREWMEPFFEMFEYQFSVLDVRLRLAGSWALEQAVFTSQLTSRHDGRSSTHGGFYLLNWRRESDGLWYIDRYIDVSELGGPGAG
jgi:uncharacterized protein (TIGR02246 family)